MKETFALHEVLCSLVAQYPDHLSGTTLVVDVDNTTMFHAFRKGRARDERVHDLIKSLFWLQVDSDFALQAKVGVLCRPQRRGRSNPTRGGRALTIRATVSRPLMGRVGRFLYGLDGVRYVRTMDTRRGP